VKHGRLVKPWASRIAPPIIVGGARDEHAASGRDASRFVVTVFTGLDERMLRADSRARQSLERAGVQRLILLVAPPFDAGEIRAAGRRLGAARA